MALFPRKRDKLDELARAVAAELVKNDVAELAKAEMRGLPAGATTTDLGPLAAAYTLGQQNPPAGQFATLPRDEASSAIAFGPGRAMVPHALDPLTGHPRPEPRQSQYQPSINLDFGRPSVPFQTLRDVADCIDVMRRCVEVRKAQIQSLDWAFTVSNRTMKRIIADDPTRSPGEAAKIAREKYAPDIDRLEQFWLQPDKWNGLDLAAWVGSLMEEQLVVDAMAIYPRYDRADRLATFEILDGGTIKPILDRRGARPMAPEVAFQQILWGFPRGEFIASPTSSTTGDYTTDTLAYFRRCVRTWTPYGFSNTEQALHTADLYLKRLDWVRAEFTDGVTPAMLFETDMKAKDITPEQLREHEDAFNDSLAGQTKERKRARLAPPGFKPSQSLTEWAQKFTAEFDEHLIKLLTMDYDIMPTEIGFPPKGGIGGKGHQEGEENTTYRKATRPTATFVASIVNYLSRNYLDMPAEIEFSYIGYEVEDTLEVTQELEIQLKTGQITLNESRAKRGMPLYTFPQADVPYIQTSAGVVYLDGSGTVADAEAPEENAPAVGAGDSQQLDTAEGTDIEAEASPEQAAELVKFVRYARRRVDAASWRPFTFDHVDEPDAAYLNKVGAAGDVDAVLDYMGKALPG